MNSLLTKCKPARLRALLLAALLAVGTTACFSPVETLPVILWEVEMEGEVGAAGPVTASVAMVANELATQIGIGVKGSGAGVPFTWSVRQGSCENPGALVVDQGFFENLTLDSDGVANSELIINRRVDIRATYSASIAHPAGGSLCRELERLN